jgi:hypothetical protein
MFSLLAQRTNVSEVYGALLQCSFNKSFASELLVDFSH